MKQRPLRLVENENRFAGLEPEELNKSEAVLAAKRSELEQAKAVLEQQRAPGDDAWRRRAGVFLALPKKVRGPQNLKFEIVMRRRPARQAICPPEPSRDGRARR